jgi:hypothetical protein
MVQGSEQRHCLLQFLDTQGALCIPLDGKAGLHQLDPAQPELPAEQRQQLDPEADLIRSGNHLPLLVEDLAIVHRELEARKETDSQPARDANGHPQGIGGGRLGRGL